jgi:hypothetical protein
MRTAFGTQQSQDDPDPPAISTNSHGSLLVFANFGSPVAHGLARPIHPFKLLPQ